MYSFIHAHTPIGECRAPCTQPGCEHSSGLTPGIAECRCIKRKNTWNLWGGKWEHELVDAPIRGISGTAQSEHTFQTDPPSAGAAPGQGYAGMGTGTGLCKVSLCNVVPSQSCLVTECPHISLSTRSHFCEAASRSYRSRGRKIEIIKYLNGDKWVSVAVTSNKLAASRLNS